MYLIHKVCVNNLNGMKHFSFSDNTSHRPATDIHVHVGTVVQQEEEPSRTITGEIVKANSYKSCSAEPVTLKFNQGPNIKQIA